MLINIDINDVETINSENGSDGKITTDSLSGCTAIGVVSETSDQSQRMISLAHIFSRPLKKSEIIVQKIRQEFLKHSGNNEQKVFIFPYNAEKLLRKSYIPSLREDILSILPKSLIEIDHYPLGYPKSVAFDLPASYSDPIKYSIYDFYGFKKEKILSSFDKANEFTRDAEPDQQCDPRQRTSLIANQNQNSSYREGHGHSEGR